MSVVSSSMLVRSSAISPLSSISCGIHEATRPPWHPAGSNSRQIHESESPMANRSLFRSLEGALIPRADARNEAGGVAYQLPSRQALAQLAATGCLNTTFYANAAEQLESVLDLSARVAPEFVAKTAVYARERAHMKDMPALLLAALSRRDPALMDRVFDRVVDSPRVLRNFVQIVRSGATGRKSLGSAPKRCVRRWLDQRTDAAGLAASVGIAPALAHLG